MISLDTEFRSRLEKDLEAEFEHWKENLINRSSASQYSDDYMRGYLHAIRKIGESMVKISKEMVN